MTKIEFHSNKIDVGTKRVDGTRKVIIEVDPYEHANIAPILVLDGQYKLKITIEDEPVKEC